MMISGCCRDFGGGLGGVGGSAVVGDGDDTDDGDLQDWEKFLPHFPAKDQLEVNCNLLCFVWILICCLLRSFWLDLWTVPSYFVVSC